MPSDFKKFLFKNSGANQKRGKKLQMNYAAGPIGFAVLIC